MKQIIFFSFIFFFVSFYLTWATTPPATMPEIPEINVNIWEILDRALNWFFGIALVVAAIMLVYAGFNYVTAGGNDEKIKTATKTLIFALIGVAIALLAKGLPLLIQDFLQGNNSTSTSQSPNTLSNDTSYDNSLNVDFSQIPLGGYHCNPNAIALDEYNCTYDNNLVESEPGCDICGGGGGGGKAEALVLNLTLPNLDFIMN